MKKMCSVLAVVLFISALPGCRQTDQERLAAMAESGRYGGGEDKDSYSVNAVLEDDFDSVESLYAYSSDIVLAELTNVEESGDYWLIYTFAVREDYTGRAEEKIFVYDAETPYKLGESYTLFLTRKDVVQYPGPYYSAVLKDFIIPQGAESVVLPLGSKRVVMDCANLKKSIEDAVEAELVGERLSEEAFLTPVSDSRELREVVGEADIVAVVSVSDEVRQNRYTSQYTAAGELLTGKGEIPPYLFLTPGLDPDEKYFVFFRCGKETEGVCRLFARHFLEVPVDSEDGRLTAELVG